jgi:DNA polymerase I
MPTLALVDGHSIAYRAFYALPEDLATTSGQVTNAAYGFTRMLIKLLGDHRPDGVAVAWDVGRVTFRTEAFGDYKAQRTAAPDHFKSQLPLIREVLDTLQVRQLEVEGYEADDVIASLTRRAVEEGWDVLLVTGDRDAFQLVGEHVKVLYTRRGISDTVMADAGYVEERYGVRPDQYVEYAALRGDTSDNLPGVPGVGEKTASKLIAGYGSLEGVFEHLEDQTPKLRENLAAAHDQVFLNRRLMRLVDDLDLGVEPEELHRRPWDPHRAKEVFTSLEFHSMFEDLAAVQAGGSAPVAEMLDVQTDLVSAPAEVEALARLRPLVVDLVEGAEFRGLAVYRAPGEAVVVPWEAAGPLRDALADPSVPVVGHDAKSLARAMLDEGGELAGLSFDTSLAAYVLDPARREYGLAEVADRYLGLEVVSPDREQAAGAQGMLTFETLPDLDLAGRRVEAIARLHEAFGAELEARDEQRLFHEVEVPLVGVLARMEHAGIGVDRAYLVELGDRLRAELAGLEREIHQAAGEPFNVNSTDQLREVLYDRLGLPVLKKTSTGKPSTDASVLEKLDHPVVERLLRYRELEKLRSTYVDGYLPLIGPDGRIHTRFNQTVAATGRLSSEEPNLQNIPVRSETGRTIRRAFVAAEGWTFVVADYSQIELRVLAHLSGDPGLVEAFAADLDIHTATAARVFGIDPAAVPPELRRRAKMINFGLLYGMEAFGLAQRLDISRDEAREHMDAYFAQFPLVHEFLEGVVAEARRQGYTTTLLGRRRYLPELKSDNFRIRQMGERMALNAPVQGSAADIIKKAMIELDGELAARSLETRQLLQIHDELVVEVPLGELGEAEPLIRAVMEGVVDLAVPLRVDVSRGSNLAESKA